MLTIHSFDDLFGTEQPQTGTEQVQEIALSELHEFKGHPFKVLDDEKMQETMESIREHGVLMPGIARPMKDGGYEIIAEYEKATDKSNEKARENAEQNHGNPDRDKKDTPFR